MHYLDELPSPRRVYGVILFATPGMMLLVSAVDMLPYPRRLMSIPIYVLAGFDPPLRSNESAMKVFLIGSFASASCSTASRGASRRVGQHSFRASGLPSIREPAPLAGLAFCWWVRIQISSVPFPQWTPDVYQRTPRPHAFMSVTVSSPRCGFLRVLRALVQPSAPCSGTCSGVGPATLVSATVMADPEK